MTDRDKQIFKTIELEGGYVNDPHDRGGETNMGITIPSWREYCGQTGADNPARSMRSLDRAAAQGFYLWWWSKPELGLTRITDPGVQFSIFDASVLSGRGTAARWAQDVAAVKQDGKIGPISAAAINALPAGLVIDELEHTAVRYYEGIADNHPNQGIYLKGWKNRAHLRAEFAHLLRNGEA